MLFKIKGQELVRVLSISKETLVETINTLGLTIAKNNFNEFQYNFIYLLAIT